MQNIYLSIPHAQPFVKFFFERFARAESVSLFSFFHGSWMRAAPKIPQKQGWLTKTYPHVILNPADLHSPGRKPVCTVFALAKQTDVRYTEYRIR